MQQALLWAACGTLFTFLMTALGASAVFFVPQAKERDGAEGRSSGSPQAL